MGKDKSKKDKSPGVKPTISKKPASSSSGKGKEADSAKSAGGIAKSSKSDIDDIFGSKPLKKKVAAPTGAGGDGKDAGPNQAEVDAERDAFLGRVKKGRKEIDGVPVYDLLELGINPDSGGTPDCPFDCDCCH